MSGPFYSIYSHGFIRAAVATPSVRVADCSYNVEHTLKLARHASENFAAITLFPELGISAYSNEDLFHQEALLDASQSAVACLKTESRSLLPVILVGAPLRFEGKLFNCAVVIYRGKVLGIVPKTYIPNYREFYEKRQFSSARHAVKREVFFLGETVFFGNDLIFDASNIPGFSLFVEICEDIWSPIPPSTHGALAGATILANLSASNITMGKTDYRRLLCASQSAKCISAYMYSAAGIGESSTDLAWDGYAVIYENNDLLAESERFGQEEQLITADIDLDRLLQDRMRITSFNDAVGEHRQQLAEMRHIPFEFEVPRGDIDLIRHVQRFPYVPIDPTVLDERCFEVYNIQVHSLIKRLTATGIERLVIGVSGGLDSTQALIVATKTMDRLGLPRLNILGYTMPGFATSTITNQNAQRLMKVLGISANEIDIKPSCMQMFRDIGHPYSNGQPVYDVTFENVQAGERTSHLFRLANYHNAIVLGTGDLSELALGWTTYGVGDQMSHYNVNASVPKTLIQYLIAWIIKTKQFDHDTNKVLRSILDTEISPELVPDDNGITDRPAQSTESIIGPYEIQDFNLYHLLRFGYRPSKVAFLAFHAWGDKTRGSWPDFLPQEKRNEYSLPMIKKWLEIFLYRFFKTSQFKRSALPNAPKVGSGGSLSPRSDWRAPSDSEATAWLNELKENVPD
ncbi:MAG: NAD(+) synthase [Desulfobacterales bacterium]|jgi:NAD+ synthase (glutamine-hydrolysing)